ncbi:Rpr2-domain-containing protein, partial [Ramicandelaber brevisporus]
HQRLEYLYALSRSAAAAVSPALAAFYGSQFSALAARHAVQLPDSVRRQTCGSCSSPFIDGVNCTVSIHSASAAKSKQRRQQQRRRTLSTNDENVKVIRFKQRGQSAQSQQQKQQHSNVVSYKCTVCGAVTQFAGSTADHLKTLKTAVESETKKLDAASKGTTATVQQAKQPAKQPAGAASTVRQMPKPAPTHTPVSTSVSTHAASAPVTPAASSSPRVEPADVKQKKPKPKGRGGGSLQKILAASKQSASAASSPSSSQAGGRLSLKDFLSSI